MTNTEFTELRGPRTQLRRLVPDDARALCAYRALPEVAKYQSWETFTTGDAERLISSQLGLKPNTPGTWVQLAIVESASGLLIGDCGLHFRADEPQQVELGITLAPSHQGRGFASEALACALSYLFDALGAHRVSAVTDAANRAAATLFQRLGFRREAHFIEHTWFKGAWSSEVLFALLRREWRARQPTGKPS